MQQNLVDDTECIEPSDDILALYIEHVPTYVADLLTAASENNRQEVQFQCHKLSSVMKVMGFKNLNNMLEKIRDDAISDDERMACCQQLDQMIRHTLVLLKKSGK